jgi:tRNA G10  N-methylase Trm11
MSEVKDESVDIIIFAPPYNISTPYGDCNNTDSKSFEDYEMMIEKVVCECVRVLMKDGICLVEAADSVYFQNKFIALSGLIQKKFLDAGLRIQERHINFLQSNNGIELTDLEHNWSKKHYYSSDEAHSNCHQWIVLSKNPNTIFRTDRGKIFYINYPSNEEGHPCPFSFDHVRIFLELTRFKQGNTLLEPFMGTGRLGREVKARSGHYIGYELEKVHFDYSNKHLL